MVDTEGPGHLPVLGEGTHGPPEVGATQQVGDGHRDHDGEEERRQLGDREGERAQPHRGRGVGIVLGADAAEVGRPQRAGQALEDDEQPEGEEQGLELGHPEPLQEPLQPHPGQCEHGDTDEDGQEGVEPVGGGQFVGAVGGEEDEREVSQVDHLEHPPAQGEPQ